MGGTRIFVLQLKQLIRMAIFALLGLALLIVLIVLFTRRQPPNPNEGSAALYVPGTYSSSIILNDKPVDVSVTVSDTEIMSVEMTEMALIQKVFYPLFEPVMGDMSQAILHYQTPLIAMETEYPVTAGILQKAVEAALVQAIIEESE